MTPMGVDSGLLGEKVSRDIEGTLLFINNAYEVLPFVNMEELDGCFDKSKISSTEKSMNEV